MPENKTRTVWRHFKTFGELTAEIQCRLKAQPMEQPFEDHLIADLIFERHYVCAPKALRPTGFKKTPEDTPYRFYGKFDQIGWHPISWRDAASKTSRKKKDALSSALRLEVSEITRAYRATQSVCERCGLRPPEETHHENPTWKEIISEVLSSAGEQAIKEELARWDWFENAPFRVLSGGIVKASFDQIHERAQLEALCKPCHSKLTNRNR